MALPFWAQRLTAHSTEQNVNVNECAQACGGQQAWEQERRLEFPASRQWTCWLELEEKDRQGIQGSVSSQEGPQLARLVQTQDRRRSMPAQCGWSAQGFWSQNAGVQIPALPLTICVGLIELLNLFVPQKTHL